MIHVQEPEIFCIECLQAKEVHSVSIFMRGARVHGDCAFNWQLLQLASVATALHGCGPVQQ